MQAAAKQPAAGPGPLAPPVDYFFGGVSAFAEQLDSETAIYESRLLLYVYRRSHIELPYLSSHLSETVLAVLRDGRHIIGTLASYDHFGTASRFYSPALITARLNG
jgi:hypothetical protein